jgi:hypothetical protein
MKFGPSDLSGVVSRNLAPNLEGGSVHTISASSGRIAAASDDFGHSPAELLRDVELGHNRAAQRQVAFRRTGENQGHPQRG